MSLKNILSVGFKAAGQENRSSAGTLFESLEGRSLMSASVVSGSLEYANISTGNLTASATTKSSTTRINIGSASSVYGQAVSLKATVASTTTGTPTGTVTFKSGRTVLGTSTLNSSGIARLTATNIPVGTTLIRAFYSGSGTFAESHSGGRSHVVTQTPTSAKLSVSTTSANIGVPVALVARIANVAPSTGVPTGRVAFYGNNSLIGSKTLNSQGNARFTLSTLFTGSFTFKAIYLGSSNSIGHRTGERAVEVTAPTLSTASNGLRSATVVAGTGAGAVNGDVLTVNYVGFFTNGSIFDTSYREGRTPFPLTLGANGVIEGWEQGLVGAKAGETRVLVIPPELAYGPNDYNGIPGGSTLIFTISILSIS